MSGIYIHSPSPVLHPWYEKTRKQRFQCGILQKLDTSHWIKIRPGLDDFRYGPPNSYRGAPVPLKKYKLSRPIKEKTSLSTNYKQAFVIKGSSTSKPTSSKLGEDEQFHPSIFAMLPMLERNLPPVIFSNLIAMLHSPDHLFTELSINDVEEKYRPIVDTHTEKESDYSEHTSVKKKKIKKSFTKAKLEIEKKDAKHLSREEKDHYIKGEVSEESGVGLGESLLQVSPFIKGFEEGTKEINPYRTFVKRTAQKQATSLTRRRHKISPLKQPEKMLSLQEIADDFCQWLQNLGEEGGEPLHMESDRLISLFAVNPDYTGLVTTVNILDKLNVPKELISSKSSSIYSRFADSDKAKKKPPKIARRRYGAWYLDVEMWKELMDNGTLENPEIVSRRKHVAELMRTDHLNDHLQNLHIIKTFRTYLTRKRLRIPNFIKNIPLPSRKSPPSESPPPSIYKIILQKTRRTSKNND